MIKVEDLTVKIKGEIILDNLNFDIRFGEKVAILGPSGEGKSVLLRTLLGLIKPTFGKVFIDGINIHTATKKELRILRKKIGILFQSSALFDYMNIEDNISFGIRVHDNISKDKQKKKIKEVLEMFGLEGSEKKMPDELSGGMQKRVALARAVIRDPSYIFYDEPTSGLDPVRAKSINNYIGNLHSKLGLTSVTITHDMATLGDLADKVLFLKNNKINYFGSIEDIKNNKQLSDFIKGID